MEVRNRLFDCHLLPSEAFPVPVIAIGNLAVGGSGKTPHTELLLRLLAGHRTAVLSRGYGRATQGFRLVEATDSAREVGDEPLQMKRKVPEATIAVDGNRRRGIAKLLEAEPALAFILLDDAFQHRYVRPALNILLTDYNCRYTHDRILPAGRLRERAGGATRADIIIVTKCPPTLSLEEAATLRNEIAPRAGQKIFFTTLRYPKTPRPAANTRGTEAGRLLAVTGIANPTTFLNHWEELGWHIAPLTFPDHHRFSPADLARINAAAKGAELVATTEKDAMRLEAAGGLAPETSQKLCVLPVEAAFLHDGEHEFSETISIFAATFNKPINTQP